MTEGLVKQSIAELRDFARCRRYMVDAVQVVADRIEELEAKLVTKKTCPLGEDCDLTVAWMAGRESAKDEYKAGIAAALEEASYALMECAVWCDSQERVDDGWRNGVADARKHISRHIYIRAAELKGEK